MTVVHLVLQQPPFRLVHPLQETLCRLVRASGTIRFLSRGVGSGFGHSGYYWQTTSSARGGGSVGFEYSAGQASGEPLSGVGAEGLVSGHRGKTSGNARSSSMRQAVLSLVRERYRDFGPTLASEKLLELHGESISREALRRWMIADGLWQSKPRRKARIHPRRPRRPGFGELVQIDGSPHDWFEGRAEPCTLIVFIDDATSRLLALRFVPAETTQAYMETLAEYLDQHGRPVALYSDKHSIFRVNHPQREGELTQFSRALKTLDIQSIHAHTPQAKGRVEKANQTLQDRLVKEMRLQGICDQDTANAFVPTFIRQYNARFAVISPKPPQCPPSHPAHPIRTRSDPVVAVYPYPVQEPDLPVPQPGNSGADPGLRLCLAKGRYHCVCGLRRNHYPTVQRTLASIPNPPTRRTPNSIGR